MSGEGGNRSNLRRWAFFGVIGGGLVLLLVAAVSFWLYCEEQENIRIDAEAVGFREDLAAEFGRTVKAADFLTHLNGELLSDEEVVLEELGEREMTLEYKNVKSRQRTVKFRIEVVDRTPPKIFSGGSYTVAVGAEDNLTEVLLSGDDADDNPRREILGEYDLDQVGSYDLTYAVTDASGNRTEKDFVLHVVKPTGGGGTVARDKIEFSDVRAQQKTEKTQIGIDVSSWQGEIDWATVKAAGVEFAMIRIGYQVGYDGELVLDKYFLTNLEGAKAVGLPVGVYLYSYARNTDQAREQAEWVKENLRGYELELPIAFDWESWSSFNAAGMSFYTINKVARTFLEVLTEAGYEGMLYGSKNYLEKIWYPTEYDVWVAQYYDRVTYGGEYRIWQMCDTGRVAGIYGDVDIDVMYLE